MLVFRSTSLNDKRHVEFAKRFGELDDIKPYLAAGRKNRLAYDELFDVSNLDVDGTVVDSEAPRAQANKVRKRAPVCSCSYTIFIAQGFVDFVNGVFRAMASSTLTHLSTLVELVTHSCWHMNCHLMGVAELRLLLTLAPLLRNFLKA